MDDKQVVRCPSCGCELALLEFDGLGCCFSGKHAADCYTGFPKLFDTPEAALAAAQKRWVEPRKPIDLADVKWLGVPYFAEYKGLDKLFCYVTGSGINADFAAARELGWTGKVLKDLWDWEDERGKLVVRLWECRNSPPTDEERDAAPWECPERESTTRNRRERNHMKIIEAGKELTKLREMLPTLPDQSDKRVVQFAIDILESAKELPYGDAKWHLCDTCAKEFPECNAEHITFGNGQGNDNVIFCDAFAQKRLVKPNDDICGECVARNGAPCASTGKCEYGEK